MPTPAPSTRQLGAVIRQLRKADDASIQDLADEAEMDASYLSNVERGLKSLGWEKLGRIAEALDTTIWEIAREAESAEPEDGV